MNYLKEKEQNPKCRGLTLFSFLIKPIQRICKYPLFLKDFVKHTPNTCPEYQIFTVALSKIEEVVDYVNERKREAESRQKIYDIQVSIEDMEEPLVHPTRKFLKETDITMPSKEDSKKVIECKAFLFNDLILFGKKQKGKKLPYSFKGKIHFSESTKVVVGSDNCEIANDKITYFFKCESNLETNKLVSELKVLTRPFQVRKLTNLKDGIGSASFSFGTQIKK